MNFVQLLCVPGSVLSNDLHKVFRGDLFKLLFAFITLLLVLVLNFDLNVGKIDLLRLFQHVNRFLIL